VFLVSEVPRYWVKFLLGEVVVERLAEEGLEERDHARQSQLFTSRQASFSPKVAHYRGTSLIRNSAPLEDPTVGICLGPYDGPKGGSCFL